MALTLRRHWKEAGGVKNSPPRWRERATFPLPSIRQLLLSSFSILCPWEEEEGKGRGGERRKPSKWMDLLKRAEERRMDGWLFQEMGRRIRKTFVLRAGKEGYNENTHTHTQSSQLHTLTRSGTKNHTSCYRALCRKEPACFHPM